MCVWYLFLIISSREHLFATSVVHQTPCAAVEVLVDSVVTVHMQDHFMC
jgi:hypothetical protein